MADMSKVEYVVLCILICTVWFLLSLPIVFYHLPVYTSKGLNQGNYSNTSSPLQTSDQICSLPFIYKGTVCHDVLQQYRNCFPDVHVRENESVLIPTSKSTIGSSVMEKIEVVKLFALSEECRRLAIPLLCLYYFGPLCDTRGVAYKVSTAQCLKLSTGVCEREWKLAEGYVPDCYSHTFGNNTVLTAACHFHQGNNESKADVSGNCSVQCSENFYCKSGTNNCVPTCSWKEHPEPSNTVIDVSVMFAASIGIVFGVLLLISACIRRKRLCTFPSVIVVYQTIAALIIATVTLVGYVDRTGLFCRSNDLLESVRNATPFCVISGMLLHYLLLFLTLWWICHISIMFWKLRFPFHARDFEIENRMKFVHIACAVPCLVLSFLPIVVITLDDVVQRAKGVDTVGTVGFSLVRFPPIICSAMNRNAIYYSLILPINLIVPVGVTLLILVVWLLYKHHRGPSKDKTEKLTLKDATAARKAFIIPCYYVVVSVVGLTGLTIVSRNGLAFTKEVLRYFSCERRGHNYDEPCDRSRFEQLHRPGLVAVSFVLFGLFPLINFIFTTNFSELIETLTSWCCRRKAAVKENESLLGKDPQTSDGELSSN